MPSDNVIFDEYNKLNADLLTREGVLARKIEIAYRKLNREAAKIIFDRSYAEIRQLTEEVNKLVTETVSPLYNEIRTGMLNAAVLESSAAINIVNAAIGVPLITNRFSRDQLETLVDNAFLNFGNEGAFKLRDLFVRREGVKVTTLPDRAVSIILGNVRQGIIQNLTPAQVAANFRTRITPPITNRNALTIARTAIFAAGNQASTRALEREKSVIKGFYVSSVLDRRTSRICQALSGQYWIYEGNELVKAEGTVRDYPGSPPYHPNCRSRLLPRLKSYEEMGRTKQRELQDLSDENNVNLSTLKANLGPRKVNVRRGTTYDTWLKTQPVSFQKEVLGPTQYQLWKGLGGNDPVPLPQLLLKPEGTYTYSISQLKERYNV